MIRLFTFKASVTIKEGSYLQTVDTSYSDSIEWIYSTVLGCSIPEAAS